MPVSLNTITVAEPGAGKTPCQRQAFRAISEFQAARKISRDQNAEENEKTEYLIWDLKNKALQSAITKSIAANADSSKLEENLRKHLARIPKTACRTTIFYDNVSDAALTWGLSKDWPYPVISNTDAGDVMLQQTSSQLTMFNKLFDGDPVQRDRLTSHSALLENKRLSTSQALQPKPMRAVLALNSGFYRSSGCLSRALISINPPRTGIRTIAKLTTQPGPTTKYFYGRCTEIMGVIAADVDAEKMDRRVSVLSDDSKEEWMDFCQRIEVQKIGNGNYSEIQDHASKIGAIVLRIAALMEFFEDDSLTINPSSLRQAIAWGLMYLENAKKLYQTSLDSVEIQTLATQLHSWMLDQCRQLGAFQISRSWLTSRCPYAFRRSPLLLAEILDVLEVQRLIQISQGKKNGQFIQPIHAPNPMYVQLPATDFPTVNFY